VQTRRGARGSGAGRRVLPLRKAVLLRLLAGVDPATRAVLREPPSLGAFAIGRWRPPGSRVNLGWNATALTKEDADGEVRPDEASQARLKTRLPCGHVDPQGGYDRWQRPWRRARFEGEYPLLGWPDRNHVEVPRVGYAPSEYQKKPWSEEAQIEGWFPLSAREHTCFDVVGGASGICGAMGERQSPAGVSGFAGRGGREDDHARHEGLGAGPLNTGKPRHTRPLHAGKPRRSRRLEADASVEEDGWRAGGVRLDTSFHRRIRKADPATPTLPRPPRRRAGDGRTAPPSPRTSRTSSSRHTSALATSPAPSAAARAVAAHVKSKPGLRARAIGGASVGSPRCAKMATTTSRSEMSATIARLPPQGQARTSTK
jgi:hypothetical protein